LKCKDCGNLIADKMCFLMGWVRPRPDITLDDELKYDRDYSPLCPACYLYRTSVLDKPVSEIDNKK
jgi:hypothetical protein